MSARPASMRRRPPPTAHMTFAPVSASGVFGFAGCSGAGVVVTDGIGCVVGAGVTGAGGVGGTAVDVFGISNGISGTIGSHGGTEEPGGVGTGVGVTGGFGPGS